MTAYNVLITQDDISLRVDQLAAGIASEIGQASTIMVGILNASVVFLSDLMRCMHAHGVCLEVDFMTMSSYGESTTPSDTVRIVQDVRADVTGRTVILVDCVADTGATLLAARDRMRDLGAGRILTCVLLDKPARRKKDIKPDFIGFSVEDRFLVGYGLDAGSRHRCFPFIAVLEIDNG